MTDLIRPAVAQDAVVVGRLLHDFNQEFDEPTPTPTLLADRMAMLIESGETLVLLAGEPTVGIAVLRFRPAIWSAGLECYLAELYVVPGRRGQGMGRALMDAALQAARGAAPTRWTSGWTSRTLSLAVSTSGSGSPIAPEAMMAT